ATAQADQFSFCIALFEALYGERPFRGSTFEELSENVVSGRVELPARRGDVPSWLRRALLRGLSRTPADRFPSMNALLAELVRDRTRRWRVAAGIAAAAIAAGSIGFALRGHAAACPTGADRAAK